MFKIFWVLCASLNFLAGVNMNGWWDYVSLTIAFAMLMTYKDIE